MAQNNVEGAVTVVAGRVVAVPAPQLVVAEVPEDAEPVPE